MPDMATGMHNLNNFGPDSQTYGNQLKAMSMCWQALDPSSSYPTANYPSQSATTTAFMPMIKNEQQMPSSQLQPSPFSSFAQQLTTLSFAPSPSSTPSKKKPTPVPDALKDEAYRERRMKNNESARRSREMRRQKEESTQRRCDQLMQENNLLRAELSLLRGQVEHFKQLISMTTASQQFSHTANATDNGTINIPQIS